MNIVNDISEAQVAFWADYDPVVVTMKAGDVVEDCEDCQALSTTNPGGMRVMRVAWKPDEIDLAHLAQGGTLWLSTWGGLPPHMLEVAPPEGGFASGT